MAKKQPTFKDQICIAEVEKHIEKSKSDIEKLKRAMELLPKVADDGDSECPFAEQLYAEKEEALEKANASLKQLDEYRQWVEDEIGKCKNDLTVITAHQEQLHKDQPRRHYSEAEAKVAATLKHLAKVKEEIAELFEQMQESIQQASQKQYPHKIPEKYPYFSASNNSSTCELDSELDDMIQQGPLEED